MNQPKHAIESERSALLLVDIQPDFMPGGNLEVEEGDRILPGVERLMDSGMFAVQAATQDWHPANHVSFASQHPGRAPLDVIELHGYEQVLWPDHCIQGTPGAELHPNLSWSSADVVIRKGTHPQSDSYSGFRNNWDPQGRRPPTGLAGYLRERGIDAVYICGLARDVCVKWTAEDAVEAGFRTHLFWDLTRSVNPSEDENLRRSLESQGVTILEHGRSENV